MASCAFLNPPFIIMRYIRIIVTCAIAVAVTAGCAAPSPQADACASPLTDAVANSCVVTKNVLWRGAKPSAEGASALIAGGVKSIVNLEMLHDDLDALTQARPTLSELRPIGYFRIRAWEPNVVIAPALLDAHIAEFLAIVRTQAKPIYVHCRAGQNRTGVMVAAYRIFEEGVNIESAIDEMEKYQGVWFDQYAAYLRQLDGPRRAKIESMVPEYLSKVRQDAQLECTNGGCVIR